jgi:Fanconi anemia group M protein
LREDPTRAAKALLRDARVEEAQRLLAAARVEHPKLRRVALVLQEQLRAKPGMKAIVFAHYRDTAEVLQEELARVEGLRPARFVGQASKGQDKGLSQREQQRLLDAFRAGEHNVLIATSVAEEGLDVPSTDLVVFYEPVPSEIRSIQRRGRTGRNRPGRVVVLVARDTRDVAAFWTARRKERAMRLEVQVLRQRFGAVNASWERPTGQRTLVDFAAAASPARRLAREDRQGIRVDHRVANGALAAALRARGFPLHPDHLPGATFSAGPVGVRVLEAREVATPAGRSRVDAELRALQRFPQPIVVVFGQIPVEAGRALRVWEERGLSVQRVRDAMEGAAILARLLGGRDP